jgi:hypothetical protein
LAEAAAEAAEVAEAAARGLNGSTEVGAHNEEGADGDIEAFEEEFSKVEKEELNKVKKEENAQATKAKGLQRPQEESVSSSVRCPRVP